MKKKIEGKSQSCSLYLIAFDGEKGNSLDEFCIELIKTFESVIKDYKKRERDLTILKFDVKEFLEYLESQIEMHWIVDDQTLTRAKMAGIQRIIAHEITQRRRYINFYDFIKYLRRSTDICFQLEWDKWEIDYIIKFIMHVLDNIDADIYTDTSSSSSDEGYEN